MPLPLVNLPGPPVWSCLLQPRCLARRGCFHVAGHLLDREGLESPGPTRIDQLAGIIVIAPAKVPLARPIHDAGGGGGPISP
jgi:hypothetical protein